MKTITEMHFLSCEKMLGDGYYTVVIRNVRLGCYKISNEISLHMAVGTNNKVRKVHVFASF